jgi:hypothetical protein
LIHQYFGIDIEIVRPQGHGALHPRPLKDLDWQQLRFGHLARPTTVRLWVLMTRIMSGWSVVAITSEVLASGRSRFPKEPVRALDAIHLGTLLVTRTSVPDLQVLSLDDRVRDHARLLGFTVLPS